MEDYLFVQKFLFAFAAVVGFLVVCFVLAYLVALREVSWRNRARAAAKTVRAELVAADAFFDGNYMPLAVKQVLDDARSSYLGLEASTWNIRRKAQFNQFATQVAAAVGEIKAAVASPFSAEEMEADRLALVAELADAEETAVAEQAAAEAAHCEELANITSNLESERSRLAKAQVMLVVRAAREKHKLLFQKTFDRYISEVSAQVNGWRYVRDSESGREMPVCEEFMREVEACLHLQREVQIKQFRANVLSEWAGHAAKNHTAAMPYSSHSTLGPAIEEYVLRRTLS